MKYETPPLYPLPTYEYDGLINHLFDDGDNPASSTLFLQRDSDKADVFEIGMRYFLSRQPPIETPRFGGEYLLGERKTVASSPPEQSLFFQEDMDTTPTVDMPTPSFTYFTPPHPHEQTPVVYAQYIPPPMHERRPIPSIPKRKAFAKPKTCEIQPWKMPRVSSSFEETIRLALRRASETVSPFMQKGTAQATNYARSLRTVGVNFLTRLDQITQDGVALLRGNFIDTPPLSFDSIIPLFESPNRIRLQPSNLSQNTSLHIFGDTLIQTLQLGKDHATAYVWEKNHLPFSITFPIDERVEDGYIEDATILSALYGNEISEPVDRLPVTVKDAALSEFGISQVLTNYIQRTIPILAREGAHLPSLEREQILAHRMLSMLPFFVEEKAPARRIEKRVMPRRTLADLFSSSYSSHRQRVTAVA